jgi:nitrogen fixation protein
MTKISQYSLDNNIGGNDRWIGSDAQNFLMTKNFTPNNVASYFNNNNVIDIGTSIRYRYQTLDVGEARQQGTISFETEVGPQVNFSSITTFLLAKNTLKQNDVTQYLNFLVGSYVLISKASNINMFGFYKISSIEPYIPDTNFFVVEVEFQSGNGFIYEDLDYLISLVDKNTGGSGGSQTLQQTLLNGNTATDIDIEFVDTETGGSLNIFGGSIIGSDSSGNFLQMAPSVFSLSNSLLSSSMEAGLLQSMDSVSGATGQLYPGYLSLSPNGADNSELHYNKITKNGIDYYWPSGDSSIIATEQYVTDNAYPLDSNPAGYLTQDQVEEYPDLASFPPTGVVGTIYIALDTGLFYTWSGTSYILSSPPDTGITGGGVINRVPKFTPDGVTIGDSNFSDTGAVGRYTIGSGYVEFITGSNIYLRLNRSTTNRMDFFLGNSGIGQTAQISSNNIIGLELISNTGYVSLMSGSNEGLRVLSSGKLQFTQAPDSGTTSDFILLRDSSGNIKQIALSGYVPYTGATQNVDLGEFELKAGQLTLDVSPTGTAAVGTTRWNNTIGSSETTLKGGNVILKNGVDLVARVVNKVTPNATLLRSNYQAVRVSGAQGQRLAIAYAQANNDNNSADTIGLVCEDIATNQEGFIMTVGQLENINTTGSLQGETWADGDVLYLSPTTPGSITNVKPSAPGHIVVMGYVEYAHINNGKIYVKIMNGWELDELHNVSISSPQNNDVLMYTSSSALWENKDPFDYFDARPVVYQKHVNMPTFASATVNNIEGVPFTVANTSARSWADTNNITRGQRIGLVVSATGNVASIRQLVTYLSRNGGFNIVSAFNMAENATDTAIRFFIGVSTTTSFSNIEPNTLLNCAGFCRLSTSNNIHLVHNDSSGTATTVDLGANFPANTVSTDKYNLIWAVVPTGLYLRIERVGTAFYYETTLTSDIPSASTGLNFGAYIVDTTGASVATGFDWYGTYIRV